MNQNIEYSPEELAILHDIYESPDTIESQAHRLPRRSLFSIDAKARSLGLVKVRGDNILRRIRELMSDGKPRTVREVEAATGARRKYITEQLRIAANGVDYHIHSYTGVHRCYVFKAGPGENAVRPPPAHTPMKVYSRRWRERRRQDCPVKEKAKQAAPVFAKRAARKVKPEAKPARPEYDPATERMKDDKYRLPATRWPTTDQTVFDAISAMARVGRQSA